MAGGVGTALLVTVMTTRTKSHLVEMMTASKTANATKELIKEASIQGINDSYLVIIGIGVVGLLLSFFIKRVAQAEEEEKEVVANRKSISAT